MRVRLLLLFLIIFDNAVALPRSKEEQKPAPPRFTQVLEHLSNPAIEDLVSPSDVVTSQPDMGNCDHFVYRVKMQLPPNINFDAALNEFISMISPGERTFTVGVLSHEKSSENGISRMARPNTSAETRARLDDLNGHVAQLLNSNAQTVLMGGTAVYSKQELVDAVRAIVDTGASEFLIFGFGQCR